MDIAIATATPRKAARAVAIYRIFGISAMSDYLKLVRSQDIEITSADLTEAGLMTEIAERTLQLFERKAKRVRSHLDQALNCGFCRVDDLDDALIAAFSSRAAEHTRNGHKGQAERMYHGLHSLVGSRLKIHDAFVKAGAKTTRSHVNMRLHAPIHVSSVA